MKNLSLILNGVLLVAVIVLYVLFFQSKKAATTEESADQIPSTTDVKSGIVYIDIDSVVSNYDMNFALQKELQEKLKTSEAQLASKERDYKKKLEDYQYKAGRGLITRSEAAEIEQNLMQQQQQFFQLQQQLQGQLAEEEQVAFRKVLNSIMVYLDGLEETHQYQFVLGRTFGGSVLYAKDNLNITQQVITGLNQEYQKSLEEKE